MVSSKVPATLNRIRENSDKMSKSEMQVCDYIVQHPEEILNLSVSGLANKSNVSSATVIRASQKIGFPSYQDLKITIACEISTPIQAINEALESGDSNRVIMEKIFQGITYTLEYTKRIQDIDTLEKVADILCHANRICICGLGASHAIATDIQHKLMRLGLNATAYSDSHLQIIGSTFVKKGDVLLAVSHSGSSQDVVHAAEIANANHATTISLTNVGRSPLADISDIALHTASNEKLYRQVALSSRIAQIALMDVIYVLIALRMENSSDNFYRIEKGLAYTKY